MAKLGVRTLNELVGRAELLEPTESLTPKLKTLDLSLVLTPATTLRPNVPTYCVEKQDHLLHKRLDNMLIEKSKQSLESGIPVFIASPVRNTDRTVGTTLSYHVSKAYKETGLPEKTIHIKLTGSAGQSLGAFLARNNTFLIKYSWYFY